MADRLKVLLMPAAGMDKPVPTLCTADGVPVPGQISLHIRADVDDVVRVVVELDQVEFGPDVLPSPILMTA